MLRFRCLLFCVACSLLSGASGLSAQAPAAPAAPAATAASAGDARSVFAQAERLRFAEDWYGAIEAYLSVLSLNPSYGEAISALAECYYELEEYDQALAYAKRAAPFMRGDSGLADLEGFIRVGSGDLAGARTVFEGVLAGRPNELDARFGLALLDLAAGRKTEAKARLEESLRISPQNARALLSLALIASDQGRDGDARSLIEKALRYHGSEPRTQYVAASLAAEAGDLEAAAFHARNALDLKSDYGEARLLLGSLMYRSKTYDQAIALMREAVSRNRKDGMAWYTLGLAQAAAGKSADAVYSFRTAAELRPDDEVVRVAMEGAVADSTSPETASREGYADWHFKRGKEFEDRSLFDQALFEYRRGLRIYPYSKKGRVLYANLLQTRGYPGKYLSELKFLKDNGKADQAILDSIEIYDSLLTDAVGRNWNIDEQALPKRPYRLALMYMESPSQTVHTALGEVLLRYQKDILSSSARASILPTTARVESLAEAFRLARSAEADYFAILTSRETDRDLEITAELRVGRTGSPAGSFTAYRTGNDRVKNSSIRIADLLVGSLPIKGKILQRSQDQVLVDLGKSEGLAKGAKLLVIKSGSIKTQAEGLGLSWTPESQLGSIDLSRAGEEASEGKLKVAGFFDTVNIGDEVLVAPPPSSPGKTTVAVPPPPPSQPFPGLFMAIRQLR